MLDMMSKEAEVANDALMERAYDHVRRRRTKRTSSSQMESCPFTALIIQLVQ